MANSRKAQKGRHKRKKSNKTKGRPEFVPSLDDRQKVEILRARKMSEDDIARVIGISKPTLLKHFKEELKTGDAKKRAEVEFALYKSAIAGNVSAQKEFLKGVEQQPTPKQEQERPSKPAKLGKKEQADADASTAGAGSDWGDDLQSPMGRPN